ncbi:MAG: pirin family protein [Flavobacterium sp.]|nr:pirin family protein [Flavobacterium sp.]
MKTEHFSATQRGLKTNSWLKSHFIFSFSEYCNPVRSAFGSIVAFNDDYVQPGKGFGIHPHVNMEIISILLKGTMNHKDSMGYTSVLEEGTVQIMSAGTGLRHEEYNVGENEVNFLQIWIEPKLQNIMPRYQQRHFPKENRKNKLMVIVSGEEGPDHCWINQNAKLSIGYFDAGDHREYVFNSNNKCLLVFVISGLLKINENKLEKREAIGIWETGTVSFTCLEETEYLIIETVINQK